jgi:hypothetical protein
MKKLIILFIFLLLPASVLSQSEWNELFFHYQTGTVPPPYYFSYDITAAPSGLLTLAYHTGYQTDSTWTYKLNIPAESFADLNKAIKESGVLTETIPELPQEHRPIGGALQHVMIILQQDPTLDQLPQRVTTPDFPEEAYKEKLNTLYEQIKKLVPASTWDEIAAKKENK